MRFHIFSPNWALSCLLLATGCVCKMTLVTMTSVTGNPAGPLLKTGAEADRCRYANPNQTPLTQSTSAVNCNVSSITLTRAVDR